MQKLEGGMLHSARWQKLVTNAQCNVSKGGHLSSPPLPAAPPAASAKVKTRVELTMMLDRHTHAKSNNDKVFQVFERAKVEVQLRQWRLDAFCNMASSADNTTVMRCNISPVMFGLVAAYVSACAPSSAFCPMIGPNIFYSMKATSSAQQQKLGSAATWQYTSA